MKKTILILFTVIFFTSCNKDGSNARKNSYNITYDKWVVIGNINNGSGGVPLRDTTFYLKKDIEFDEYIEINKKEVLIVDSDKTLKFKYTGISKDDNYIYIMIHGYGTSYKMKHDYIKDVLYLPLGLNENPETTRICKRLNEVK